MFSYVGGGINGTLFCYKTVGSITGNRLIIVRKEGGGLITTGGGGLKVASYGNLDCM